MAQLIDGKAIAAEITQKVKIAADELLGKTGVQTGLAVVIVGEDPASQVYVANKGRTANACGFKSVEHKLPEDTSQQAVLDVVNSLNNDPTIHGILVQLPLPKHLDEELITQAIVPEKDVDGFNFVNVGKLGAGEIETAFVPCTPAGSMLLLERVMGRDLSGKNAVVIGRSNIVGKPMFNLLLAANATVTIAHSRTKNLEALCKSADILVAAVGRPEMVKANWIKPGAAIIDVGINRIDAPERGEGKTRLVGDVDFASCEPIAGAITPVPGGVGPMTIAMLMANAVTSAHRAAGETPPRF